MKSLVTAFVFAGLGFAGGLAVNLWPTPQGALAGEDAGVLAPERLSEKPLAMRGSPGQATAQLPPEPTLENSRPLEATAQTSPRSRDRVIYDPETYVPPPRPAAHKGVDLTHVVDP